MCEKADSTHPVTKIEVRFFFLSSLASRALIAAWSPSSPSDEMSESALRCPPRGDLSTTGAEAAFLLPLPGLTTDAGTVFVGVVAATTVACGRIPGCVMFSLLSENGLKGKFMLCTRAEGTHTHAQQQRDIELSCARNGNAVTVI